MEFQNVSKAFVYITDCNPSLNKRCLDCRVFIMFSVIGMVLSLVQYYYFYGVVNPSSH